MRDEKITMIKRSRLGLFEENDNKERIGLCENKQFNHN